MKPYRHRIWWIGFCFGPLNRTLPGVQRAGPGFLMQQAPIMRQRYNGDGPTVVPALLSQSGDAISQSRRSSIQNKVPTNRNSLWNSSSTSSATTLVAEERKGEEEVRSVLVVPSKKSEFHPLQCTRLIPNSSARFVIEPAAGRHSSTTSAEDAEEIEFCPERKAHLIVDGVLNRINDGNTRTTKRDLQTRQHWKRVQSMVRKTEGYQLAQGTESMDQKRLDVEKSGQATDLAGYRRKSDTILLEENRRRSETVSSLNQTRGLRTRYNNLESPITDLLKANDLKIMLGVRSETDLDLQSALIEKTKRIKQLEDRVKWLETVLKLERF